MRVLSQATQDCQRVYKTCPVLPFERTWYKGDIHANNVSRTQQRSSSSVISCKARMHEEETVGGGRCRARSPKLQICLGLRPPFMFRRAPEAGCFHLSADICRGPLRHRKRGAGHGATLAFFRTVRNQRCQNPAGCCPPRLHDGEVTIRQQADTKGWRES